MAPPPTSTSAGASELTTGTPADIAKKVGELESDNKTQRDEIRDLKLTLPKETEVVVPKEKADALVDYEKLGKPEELNTLATERDDS